MMKAVLVLLPTLVLGAAAQDTNSQTSRTALDEALSKLQELARQRAFQEGAVMGPAVKGAPYSALETVETTQTLGDGTHIKRITETMVYRDSEGRIRRETPDSVTIWDPVARVSYALDPKAQTARKMPLGLTIFRAPSGQVMQFRYPPNGSVPPPLPRAGNGSIGVSFSPSETDTSRALLNASGVSGGVFVQGVAPGSPAEKAGMQNGDVIVSVNGRPVASDKDLVAAISGLKVGTSVNVTAVRIGKTQNFTMAIADRSKVFPSADRPVPQAASPLIQEKAAPKTESLGQQAIEGINAEGTRETSTIETGEIGNDRPIHIISERWYSPDLKTDVKMTRSDPRTGQETFTLTNIIGAEPAPDLFQVPANYQMVGPK
jgi:hypothetical protein